MRSTSRRARSTAALIGAVAWFSTGIAVAVTPPPSSTFNGSTNQTRAPRHELVLRTNTAGKIARLQIGWKANCRQPGAFWSGETVATFGQGGLPTAGGKFHAAGSYVRRLSNGISGKISIQLQGEFTSKRHVQGKFSAQVKVMRAGRQIDACSMSTRWHADRA